MLLDFNRLGALRYVLIGVMILVLLFLVLPIVFIAALSFGSSQWLIFPPPSWTTKWYAELFADPRWLYSALTSLKIAVIVTILSVIWDFNVFNQIWLVSQGGPGDSTTTLGVFSFTTAFVGFDIGKGAAISVVTTILLVVMTAFYIRNLLRSGEDL